jgi:O-antigen ligase
MISPERYLSIDVKAIWRQLKQEPFHFWLFCGYLIFEYVRPQQIYPFIDIIPWAKLLVLGTLIGTFLAKEEAPPSTPLAKYYWGLMLAVFLSCVFAEFPGYSFSKFFEAFNWLIIFYLFIRIVTSRFRFFIVLLLILLASYKMSQHAAISWARRGFTFERWGIAGGAGFFGNAADLGVQMLLVLPLSIVFYQVCHTYWGRFKKILFLLFPLTVLMAIIATGERNTLVGLAGMCLVFVLTQKNRLKNIILISIFAAVFIAAMPQELKDRFDTIGKDNTSLSRITYWKRGIDFFKEHPIVGIGYYNWIPYYVKYHPGESLRQDHQEIAHSTPIIVLAELGVLGFIFYYCIAVRMILLNIRSSKIARLDNERLWESIPFGLNIGIIGFLGASIFITVTFYPFLFIHASLTAALHNVLIKERRAITEKNHDSIIESL